ncbi:uncharacterized protein K452DRAFT_240704 [Aplosporella prunicola CBS 121167]|uniref:Ribosomal protein S17 n=1 Tax=Aplosporella prunicola CBS 121167 TaxID=1176127 RepID=A0A6A6BT70_9PEZI|nr:uncharacterized protein K452DRAFT_240704 [Aplosporella prunicola CBS 121167]KAF2147319.1 hypothetical protein K452DRAFT_240704 [Aplosporella prunicola CBS 121167]
MAAPAHRKFTGVVVSAGKMEKAVKVRLAGQEWDKHIRKYFPAPYTVLVSDPNNSLREGDVINLRSGYRASKTVRHVVTSFIAPFGSGISERPPLPTEEELAQKLLQKRYEKDFRQASRGREAAYRRIKTAALQESQILYKLGQIQGLESMEDAESLGYLQAQLEKLKMMRREGVQVGEAGPPGGEESLGSVDARARYSAAKAARFTKKALENEEDLEKAQGKGASIAEEVARGAKAI